jgi:hypothetical protein
MGSIQERRNKRNLEKVRLAARRITGRMKRLRMETDQKGYVRKVLERPSEMVRELGWDTLEKRRKNDRLVKFF